MGTPRIELVNAGQASPRVGGPHPACGEEAGDGSKVLFRKHKVKRTGKKAKTTFRAQPGPHPPPSTLRAQALGLGTNSVLKGKDKVEKGTLAHILHPEAKEHSHS